MTEEASAVQSQDNPADRSKELAGELRKTLYSRYFERRPPLVPEQLALTLYARFCKGPFVILWSTDGSGEVMDKLGSLDGDSPAPVMDAISESIVSEMLSSLHTKAQHREEAMRSARELYVQLRAFETPGLGRSGFVYIKGWDRDFLDEELYRTFGKDYETLYAEVYKRSPDPLPPPAPSGRPINYLIISCSMCGATYCIPFTALATDASGKKPDIIQEMANEPEMNCCTHSVRIMRTLVVTLVEDV